MDIDKVTSELIKARQSVYAKCRATPPDPYGIGQAINELSHWSGELSDYLGQKTKDLNDAKAQTYFGMIKSGQSINQAVESSRHEHKQLEGDCGKLKLLLDSASSRITSAQTVIKTLDVERPTGGLQT